MGLKEMRKRAGMSVLDVQKALNVSDAAVYYWENGTTMPTVDKLIKLAELFGCTIDELVKSENSVQEKQSEISDN